MRYTLLFYMIICFFGCSTCLAATFVSLQGTGGRQASNLFTLEAGYYQIEATGVLKVGTTCLAGGISRGKPDNVELFLFDTQDSVAKGKTGEAKKRLWIARGKYRFVAGCYTTNGPWSASVTVRKLQRPRASLIASSRFSGIYRAVLRETSSTSSSFLTCGRDKDLNLFLIKKNSNGYFLQLQDLSSNLTTLKLKSQNADGLIFTRTSNETECQTAGECTISDQVEVSRLGGSRFKITKISEANSQTSELCKWSGVASVERE